MRNKTLITLAVAAVTTFSLVSATFADDAATFNQQVEIEKFWKMPDSAVVGSVNGINVTKGELMKTLWYWNAPNVLADLLTQKMIQDAADKAGVKLDYADVNARLDETMQQMRVNNMDQLVAQARITENRLLAGTKMSVLAEKVIEKEYQITDDQLAEYVKASHILVQFPRDEADPEKQDEIAKAKIDEVYERVQAGGDFASLANQYSDDPGNGVTGQKKGGELGWFTHGQMVPEFEKAAFELKPGEVSEPVKTSYGYHIIKVESIGKDANAADKAELNKLIAARSMQVNMGRWFQEIQMNSKVVNNLMPPVPETPRPPVANDMPPAPPQP